MDEAVVIRVKDGKVASTALFLLAPLFRQRHGKVAVERVGGERRHERCADRPARRVVRRSQVALAVPYHEGEAGYVVAHLVDGLPAACEQGAPDLARLPAAPVAHDLGELANPSGHALSMGAMREAVQADSD